MTKKLIVFEPTPKKVDDLRRQLNQFDVLEKNLMRDINRRDNARKNLTSIVLSNNP